MRVFKKFQISSDLKTLDNKVKLNHNDTMKMICQYRTPNKNKKFSASTASIMLYTQTVYGIDDNKAHGHFCKITRSRNTNF